MSHAALCDVRDDERLSGLLAGCRDRDIKSELQEEGKEEVGMVIYSCTVMTRLTASQDTWVNVKRKNNEQRCQSAFWPAEGISELLV